MTRVTIWTRGPRPNQWAEELFEDEPGFTEPVRVEITQWVGDGPGKRMARDSSLTTDIDSSGRAHDHFVQGTFVEDDISDPVTIPAAVWKWMQSGSPTEIHVTLS